MGFSSEMGKVLKMADMSLSSDGKSAFLDMGGILDDALSYAKSTWVDSGYFYTDVEVIDATFIFTIDPPSKITGWSWSPTVS